MIEVVLLNPLAQIKVKHAHFLRDWCGGELPTSLIYPPLDLAYVAALLRKNSISVALIDASTLHIPHKKVINIMKKEKPKFIGIPSAWGSFYDDLVLSKMLKEAMPSAKIILSGPNVTIDPKSALDSGYVDYCILGELETPFLDIVKGNVRNNIAYKPNGKIVQHERGLLENLDSLPFPARDLLPNRRYCAPFIAKNPFTTLVTSRGCPYKCTFCQVNIWNLGRMRFRSIANVIEEIDEVIKKFNLRQIIFRDQTLTIRRDRVMDLCAEIIKKKYDISWRCFSCVDTVDRELLKFMKKAGCHQISYGFESGNQHVLDLCGKGITIEQSRRAAKLTKEAGIEVSGSFMFGMYGDTEESIRQTFDFALFLNCDYAQFQLASPVPSTGFYTQSNNDGKEAKRESFRWHKWITAGNSSLSNQFLQKKLKQAYQRFYFRPSYIYRHIRRLKSPKQILLFLQAFFHLFIHD